MVASQAIYAGSIPVPRSKFYEVVLVRKFLSIFYFAITSLMLFSFFGCMTVDSGMSTSASRRQEGVYHKVQKGETLWRIAKKYQVDIDYIIRSNNIPNGAHLEEHQLIFIPGANLVKVTTSAPLSTTTAMVKDDFGWPVAGRVIRYFGEKRGSYLSHGIGIETMEGQPVTASRQGKVVFADYLAGYYYTVILDHMDGYFTVYGFNSKIAVGVGDVVVKGQKLALAGKKGNSPLLYFEIRRYAKAENPLYFLPKI